MSEQSATTDWQQKKSAEIGARRGIAGHSVLSPQVAASIALEAMQAQEPRTPIRHCDDCGGSWVDDGINAGCYCMRVKEAERQRDEALELLERADTKLIGDVYGGHRDPGSYDTDIDAEGRDVPCAWCDEVVSWRERLAKLVGRGMRTATDWTTGLELAYLSGLGGHSKPQPCERVSPWRPLDDLCGRRLKLLRFYKGRLERGELALPPNVDRLTVLEEVKRLILLEKLELHGEEEGGSA